MSTLLITIIPSIIILSYFTLSDKFKEPKGTVLLIFFLGFLICLPAGILNSFMDDQFNTGSELSRKLLHSFLGPAWTEELLKFLILYTIVLRRHEFNEPMDGIVYGVVVSLGFATYENYDYVFRWAEEWGIDPQQMAIWRSYSAVPMHGLNGVIMGFYFGLYAFTAKKKFLTLALIFPYLIHGFYNFVSSPYHYFIVVGILIFALILHSNLKMVQSEKKIEKEKKQI